MKTHDKVNHDQIEAVAYQRRHFLKNGVIFGALTGVAGFGLITGCKNETGEGISPAEDLMREHGVLNRIMLIYDNFRDLLLSGKQFSLGALNNSAEIIRNFIEGYHEKLEEDFLFPQFRKAGTLADLVQVLRSQHQAGREITSQIIQLTDINSTGNTTDTLKLIRLLNDFNKMYRPHAAREDTVLFPSIRKVVSENEYFDLGENFEQKEHELFGNNGFETIVEKVAGIEEQLGIYDLSEFTPS